MPDELADIRRRVLDIAKEHKDSDSRVREIELSVNEIRANLSSIKENMANKADIETIRTAMTGNTGKITAELLKVEIRMIKWVLALGIALIAIILRTFNLV